MREGSAGFRVPLARVTISPGDRLAAFLIEVTRDRMGIIRDITDVLRDLGLNLHNISAYAEGGRGAIYLVVNVSGKPESIVSDIRDKFSSIDGIGRILYQISEKDGLLIDTLNFPLMRYDDRIFTLTEEAWKTLTSDLTAILGSEAYHAIIYRIGYEMGKGFAENYVDIARRVGIEEPMDVIRYVMSGMLAASGWGRSSLEIGENSLRIKIEENLEAEASPKSNEPSCYFTKGVITGALTRILRSPVEVRETRCKAAGDEYCEFIARY